MDPSILKFLEDDEDETMHSGADVEAFTAALNRDIEGNTSSLDNQPPDPKSGVLSKDSSSTSQILLGQWQASSQDSNLTEQTRNQGEKLHLSQCESVHQVSGARNQCQNEGQQECDQLLFKAENCLTNQQQQNTANPLQFVDNNQIKDSEQSSAHCPLLGKPQHSESQKHNEQQLNSQQLPAAAQANNSVKQIIHASVPFFQLLQTFQPHLDKDRYMQLQAVTSKLKSQEMTKQDFLRFIRSIVGDQMIRQAAQQLQMQLHVPAAHSINPNQLSQIQASPHQSHIHGSTDKMQADASFSAIGSNTKIPQETESRTELRGMHAAQSSSNGGNDTEGPIPKMPLQTVKKPMQNMQLPPAFFSMYGSNSNFYAHAYPNTCISTAVPSLKSQTQNSHMRQATFTQSMSSTNLVGNHPMNMVNVPRRELQNAANETKRFPVAPLSHSTSQQHNPVAWQSASIPNNEQRNSSLPSVSCVKQEVFDQDSQSQSKPQFTVPQCSSIGSIQTDQGNKNLGPVKYERQEVNTTKVGVSALTSMPAQNQVSGSGIIQNDPAMQMQARNLSAFAAGTMPPKKPIVGQKKPLEAQGHSPPQASKKQKTSGSGALLDQSIEQLNDVTAVSGVNLREEEEQLLSAPKEDTRASESTRKFVQEEEDRLILQKELLHKKLVEIMFKYGLERIGNNVERFLSMCVEERLRGLISNMIRFSKQRSDVEKSRHRFVVTSDVKRKILVMNQNAKEEWEKKQAEEAEKLQKHNEAEGNMGQNADKDKDESRSKSNKVNKEEDDKMRATAANVAARAAVGGDDMLSKWQLMAEQARQEREGIIDGTSSYRQGRFAGGKLSTNGERRLREHREGGMRGAAASLSGNMRILGKRPGEVSHPEAERILSTKDLIAVLEKEPQMSRSNLIYRLYDKMG